MTDGKIFLKGNSYRSVKVREKVTNGSRRMYTDVEEVRCSFYVKKLKVLKRVFKRK